MKILRCVQCEKQVEVEGAVDRVWCIDCAFTKSELPVSVTLQRNPRTELFQARLI